MGTFRRYRIRLALSVYDDMQEACPLLLQELIHKLALTSDEISGFREVAENIRVNYDADKELFLPDDTFQLLEPFDVKVHKNGNIPLYHKICFDRLQRYRVIKQADTILLHTLFPDEFTDQQKRNSWAAYEPITLHDSTLSFGAHALFAAQLGLRDAAWEYFCKSLLLDLEDVMGNTGNEGLHMAALGATWQSIVMGFCGFCVSCGQFERNAILPSTWKEIRFMRNLNGKVKQCTARNGAPILVE